MLLLCGPRRCALRGVWDHRRRGLACHDGVALCARFVVKRCCAGAAGRACNNWQSLPPIWRKSVMSPEVPEWEMMLREAIARASTGLDVSGT